MLTKETAKGHILTSTICRNLEFYQNDTKIRRKLAYEMYSYVQLLRASPPYPLTRGSAPGPRWGHSPQTPTIGSRYLARHSPQMLKPNSAYDDKYSVYHNTIPTIWRSNGRKPKPFPDIFLTNVHRQSTLQMSPRARSECDPRSA